MIYENIQRLCKEHKISIFRLEKACGLGNGTIGGWAGRKAAPKVTSLKAIADYFGVTVDELLKE